MVRRQRSATRKDGGFHKAPRGSAHTCRPSADIETYPVSNRFEFPVAGRRRRGCTRGGSERMKATSDERIHSPCTSLCERHGAARLVMGGWGLSTSSIASAINLVFRISPFYSSSFRKSTASARWMSDEWPGEVEISESAADLSGDEDFDRIMQVYQERRSYFVPPYQSNQTSTTMTRRVPYHIFIRASWLSVASYTSTRTRSRPCRSRCH